MKDRIKELMRKLKAILNAHVNTVADPDNHPQTKLFNLIQHMFTVELEPAMLERLRNIDLDDVYNSD